MLGMPSKKNCDKCHIGFDPPPNVTKNTMYFFFKETRPFLGTFAKKKIFAPLKGQNTCKNLKLLKWAKNGTPHFSPKFFFQNDSEWREMDFKHKFIKCDILTS